MFTTINKKIKTTLTKHALIQAAYYSYYIKINTCI